MYVVMEVCDREATQTMLCPTIRKAVDTANLWLKNHCDLIGRSEDHDAAERLFIDSNINPGEDGDGIAFATQDSMNAWCNWKNHDFDVHIVQAYEPVSEEEAFERLKTELFMNGRNAINDFLDYETSPEEDKDVTENRMDEAGAQMPREELTKFYMKYGISILE